MRRVEARRTDIANRARIAHLAVHRILRTERIAVILDEPQVMLVTKRFDRREIERIAERMRDHDRLRPL